MTERTIENILFRMMLPKMMPFGHYLGKVENNVDEKDRGRVLCTVPAMGWMTQDEGVWAWPTDKHSMSVPAVGEWVEIYFLDGNINMPRYTGIDAEMTGMKPQNYSSKDTHVIFESPDTKENTILYDEKEKKLRIVIGSCTIIIDGSANTVEVKDGNGNEITTAATGITLKTGDAAIWAPCILPNCLYSGAPHGGTAGGIVKLKGA